MRKWVLKAPAKVNLFLSVGPKDERSYHPLRTIFQAVSLFDEIEVCESATETSVTFNDLSIPSHNTVTKTLRLLSNSINLAPLKVHVTKQIPSQSGLGGGSSDAGVLLRFIRDKFHPELSDTHLIQTALKVGADVPFFLRGGLARAEGYGEELAQLSDPPETWFVVAKPLVGCPTNEMFQKLDSINYDWLPFPIDDKLYNDFERVAPIECLDLRDQLLSLGAFDSALSGSGSAVFGRFISQEEAYLANVELGRQGFASWAVKTLSESECSNLNSVADLD